MSDALTFLPGARPRAIAPPPPKSHFVRFYDDDGLLCDVVGEFIEKGLTSSEGAIVIASREHREGFERALRGRGVHVPAARQRGQLLELDAEETLAKFVVGSLETGTPDRAAFMQVVGGLMERTVRAFPKVRAYGEMVNVLLQRGNLAGATRLEELWNELAQAHTFQLYCAYRMDLFGSTEQAVPFKAVCSLHSHVMPQGPSDATSHSDEHLRELAELRQRARALEAEVVARKAIEEALRERESELQDFLESATECLHGIGPDGRIVWANTAELELLGYSRDEYIGKHVSEIHADAVEYMLERLTRGERLLDWEASLRAKDGSLRHVLINSTPLVRDGRFIQTRCFTRDITERKRAEEAMVRLAAIVECSDDTIISKTLDGVIRSWNRAAEAMFGYTAQEAVGSDIRMIIPEERWSEEQDVLSRLRRGEKIDHFETVRRAKDGRLLDISLTVSPVKDGTGRIIGASKVARDITERKRADAERQRLLEATQQARREAERALQVKDEFLATVSHELRTPLNAIIGWTHLLRTGSLDDDGNRRAIETISRNATAQNQLIGDILDVQRLTSGKFRLEIRDDADLALAVEAGIDTVRPAAQAKGITLTPRLENVSRVPGDPDRIQQIVWNLLSNAVKFTPRGGRVDVRLRDADDYVEITVEDDGPGIRPEFLPFVFQRFRQDSAGSRKPGLGLGLAIVRHLVELHGGIVSAANREEGSGAVFTVRLPRVRISHVEAVRLADGEASTQADIWRETAPSLHGARVLVVDDEPEAREVLAAILSQCGADVAVATSTEDALAQLAREPADVLVCDINMPRQDGYNLLQAIRALPAAEGGLIPAIALTAATSAADRLRAVRAGFQFHVPKPAHPAELAAVVASLVARRRVEST